MLASVPGVIDVIQLSGAARAGPSERGPDLVIEIPHGATATSDFTALAARMQGRLPEDLVDFFHVNTDCGAPELAVAVAERVVADDPERAVTILRCRIPRTLVDCNRVLDLDRAQYEAGNVAPGMFPWVTEEADTIALRGLYERYVDTVAAALDGLPTSSRPPPALASRFFARNRWTSTWSA
jgi:hypothetical protein